MSVESPDWTQSDLKALSDGGCAERARHGLRETVRQSLDLNWQGRKAEDLQRTACFKRRARGDSA
jgi:hypothetical protein